MAKQGPLNDRDYDLISVVYHASQGAETCRQYASDAEEEGDQDTARFFEEVQNRYVELANRGKDLLKTRMS